LPFRSGADGLLPAMRQQLPNPAVGLRRQPFEHILEIRKGLVAVEPRGLDQAHDRSGTLARRMLTPFGPSRASTGRDVTAREKKGRRGYRDSPLSTGHDGERPRPRLSELLRPDCARLRLRSFRRRRGAQGRAGTISSASPSRTTVSPTVHTVENTARRFAGFSSVIVALATTVSPIFTGALNFRLWLR